MIVNLVVGHELLGPGMDGELKAFVGYRPGESVRVGLDARVAAEFHDENGYKQPEMTNDVGFTGGPAVTWIPTERLVVQGLLGVSKPRGLSTASPAAILTVSFDF